MGWKTYKHTMIRHGKFMMSPENDRSLWDEGHKNTLWFDMVNS